MFTTAQKTTLKADILAKQANGQPLAGVTDEEAIAAFYNDVSSPVFTAWRTNVTRAQVYHQTSAEGTTWNWTTYKAQSQGEQGSWVQMFMGDQANMALSNLRLGVENIFGVNNAQTTHVKAIGKRTANRVERLLATGTGSLASPGVMTFEGSVTPQEISDTILGV